MPRVVEDLVVHLGAPPPGHVEPAADLHPLHGLDAHEALGQPAVELPVPVHVAPQARRDAGGHHLEDPAQSVPLLLALVDERDGLLLGFRVRHAHGRVLGQLEYLVVALAVHVRLDPPEGAQVTPHLHRERRHQLLAERAHRHA